MDGLNVWKLRVLAREEKFDEVARLGGKAIADRPAARRVGAGAIFELMEAKEFDRALKRAEAGQDRPIGQNGYHPGPA